LFVYDRQEPIERLAPAGPQLGEHIGTGSHLIESSSALNRGPRQRRHNVHLARAPGKVTVEPSAPTRGE
jgi:hypothetical protein